MDPKKITELANLLRQNGDKLLNSESAFTLSGSMLRALNDSFTLIADSVETGEIQSFQVVKPMNHKSPVFRDLQLIYDFVQKTTMLCIKHYPTEDYFEGHIDISKFRALLHLEVQKTKVRQITGIQPLRSQIQQLTCTRSLDKVDEIITNCGGDKSNGFVWNELKRADFSYNNLKSVDTSLEFAQYLQHLNLRHNQLSSVEAIKWLPHLKTLDLSYNCLVYIPKFHVEAYKRLQSLNMSNNYIEDLNGIAKLEAITDLDLSDNCLLEHGCLLPISALLTLKFLNLYGNPLSCHPKHRLVTAQYLNKNCSTVRFVLDFAELTKNEKAITGRHQLRQVGSLHQFMSRSASTSISLNSEAFASHTTPASSVGSIRSFKFQGSNDGYKSNPATESSGKKRTSKVRTVEIEEIDNTGLSHVHKELSDNGNNVQTIDARISQQKDSMSKSLLIDEDNEHLETKEQIKTLREKYGSEWLQYGTSEIGLDQSSESTNARDVHYTSRKLFNEFLGEFSDNNKNESGEVLVVPLKRTSTPTSNCTITSRDRTKVDDSVLYMSTETPSNTTKDTIYKTALDDSEENIKITKSTSQENLERESLLDEDPEYLRNVYPIVNEESDVSEPEDDEKTYIVYTPNHNEALFLTISSNFVREKDAVTQRTKTKWSLKILESCDRVKSNMLRINFDTVKLDKQERIYIVEDGLCQELEKLLRNILSKRDLAEMNQTIYRCVNCTCQFSQENRNTINAQNVSCPDCKSIFVAEINEIPKKGQSSINAEEELSLSPAAIVEECPLTTPIVLEASLQNVHNVEETTSIGSANSLNESSSCSKITNSQSSFDSNQSVVGSTNTERDIEMNCESDVDILSNPSQSSIEILDHMLFTGRKTSSEERRVSQMPHLETIADQSFKNEEFPDSAQLLQFLRENTLSNKTSPSSTELLPPNPLSNTTGGTAIIAPSPLAHFNLTESSSSGSITDSICTTYEQQKSNAPIEETKSNEQIDNYNVSEVKAMGTEKPEGTPNKDVPLGATIKRQDSGISNVLGALFQSTNVLMSSSKKMLDAESGSRISVGTIDIKENTKYRTENASMCRPYKFNYTDFNDVDHRLKLYFYQSKFEENGEHFIWLVRGCIYNANTMSIFDGILIMSTCKCYVMEAYASENDDVTKWLKQYVSATVDRLECIQLLPWKLGVSLRLKGLGEYLLLLKDIARTNNLMMFFESKGLQSQCELIHQQDEVILKRLSHAIAPEKLEMMSLLNQCVVVLENGQRSLKNCCLLVTDKYIHLSTEKFNWLSQKTVNNDEDPELEIAVRQFMMNLNEIERIDESTAILNFLDEVHGSSSTWTCSFETRESTHSCLIAISQSWEKLFGVPLITDKELLVYS